MNAKRFIAVVCASAGIVPLLYIELVARFIHPDWTETQLLLRNWRLVVVGASLILVAWALVLWNTISEERKAKENDDG